MTKTFGLLATALLVTTIAAPPSGIAQRNPLTLATYDATVQQHECNGGLGSSTAEWVVVEPKRAPGDDLSEHGIINGQNLSDGGIFRTRLTNPKKVWYLRTVASGTVGSAANAGYRIRVVRITGRRRTNSDFRSITVHFKADPSVSRANILITGSPQNPNQASRVVQLSNVQITGTPGEWQVATANYTDFGFPDNIFVRQFNVTQVNAANRTSTVQFGRFDVRNTPVDALEQCTIYFDNLRCNGFSRN